MIPENPEMLASYLNLKLRDEYPSLEALCDDMDLSESEILDKLKKAGYGYNKETNQIR